MWCNQIFSLIKDKEIQNIIVCDNYEVASQIARFQYGDDAIAIDTTQYPLGVGCKYIDGLFYEEDGVAIINRTLTADEEAAIAKKKVEALDAQINPQINFDTCTLDECKLWQISLSKKNLELYLAEHPITSKCHGGAEKQYTITKDKQTLLTQEIMVAQLAAQPEIEYRSSWNATGEECTYDWTITELQQLATEMAIVIKPLISKQQNMEISINSKQTKEDILTVDITF
ncbi:hypothetical protein [Anaerocolumna xylanovorans]|uniref:DUF4376 domain-containing protein n=1 Tax=Anaerocolumna xylanovorans DSM 12503 TaxID=1121345 RepID=A0A1M7YMB2_9FIRM|nr:hypothetical protein [Anaerocolumna xylanovorans]SHO53712.1 hypothetical protein SAMN02745217_04251 [Anaerocolumna xylanovorans DSM 12503]